MSSKEKGMGKDKNGREDERGAKKTPGRGDRISVHISLLLNDLHPIMIIMGGKG